MVEESGPDSFCFSPVVQKLYVSFLLITASPEFVLGSGSCKSISHCGQIDSCSRPMHHADLGREAGTCDLILMDVLFW